MSKQLIIGLTAGALFTGLGFMMFGSASIPVPAVSDSGDLRLLAQVIPNEPLQEEATSSSPSNIIEVRSAPAKPVAQSAAKAKPIEASEVSSEDSGEEAEEELVAEVVLCAYATNDKPKLEGILSEVAWMGSGDDANAEWVEIQNRTRDELDVSGWQLVDKAEQIQVSIPEGVVLPRSGFLLFERDEHQLPGATVLYKGAISNTDEGLRLFDANCDLQDEVIAKSKWPAGTNSPKRTAERAKDLSWHTFYGDDEAGIFGTPGKKNSAGPPPEPDPEPESDPEPEAEEPESEPEGESESEPETETPAVVTVTPGQLIISEVMAGTEANVNDEFVELYNMTDSAISLEGFSIRKKTPNDTSGVTEASLVSAAKLTGKSIAPGARFVIGREGQFTGMSDALWAKSNYLVDKSAFGKPSVLLYNAQVQPIDEVSWTEIPAGQSYACESQGSCAVQETPNPGE